MVCNAMMNRDLLLALAVPVLWGFAFALGKPATEHFPPLLMFAGVYGFVAILFTALFPGRFLTPFWSGLVLGTMAGSLQAILIFTGLGSYFYWEVRRAYAQQALEEKTDPAINA